MSSSLVRGRILVNPRGFGFLEIEGGPPGAIAFIPPPDLNPFLAGDVVTAALKAADHDRTTATSLTLVERRRRELFGTVVFHGKRAFLKTDRQIANTDWPLQDNEVVKVPEGTAVVAQIFDGVAGSLRVLGRGDDPQLVRVLVRHGVHDVYAPELLAAAETIAAQPFEQAGRRDLRELPMVTIDDPSTRDIDDAVSVLPADDEGALRVFVSIADVDAYVPAGSPLDVEARRRATSVYLAGHVVPMFPPALCDGAISLLEGQDRPAMTVEFRLDAEGRVLAVDVYASLVRSLARLSYDAVTRYYATGDAGSLPAAVLPSLRWLRTAAARLSTARAARGGIDLLREEAYVTLDATTGTPTGLEVRADTESHRLVERLMVATNEAIAQWLVDRGLPGMFRVHDEPDPDRVALLAGFAQNFGFETGFGPHLSPRGLAAFEAQFRGSAPAPAIRTALGNVLPPATYTPTAAPHFGLAAPLYAHFTSPIRRYSDLTVHRIVKAFLGGQREFLRRDASWSDLAAHIQQASTEAAKAERDYLHILAARLFTPRIGETLVGYVVGIRPFGLVVQLAGMGVTGTIASDALPEGPYRADPAGYALVSETQRYAVGRRLDVTVAATQEDLGRIELIPKTPPVAESPSPEAPARVPTKTAPSAEPPPAASKRPRASSRGVSRPTAVAPPPATGRTKTAPRRSKTTS